MNYLAHLRLSRRDKHSIIGNLMGDFRRYLHGMILPADILVGVKNHQRVDKFTDSHAEIRRLKTCFSRKRRRYAGIILDVAFDHFLALHWNRFSQEPRDIFIRYCYSCLAGGMDLMPARMQQTVTYMIHEDWLGSYEDLSGIGITLDRLARRIRFENYLGGSVEEVAHNYDYIEEGFQRFFPAVMLHVNGINRQADVIE